MKAMTQAAVAEPGPVYVQVDLLKPRDIFVSTSQIRSDLRASHTMANLRFCDQLIANPGKIAICIPSQTVAINIRELLGFPAAT